MYDILEKEQNSQGILHWDQWDDSAENDEWLLPFPPAK